MTTQSEPLSPSKKLGDYRLLRQVGRGGMGVVYEAEQASLGRRVAVKVVSRSGMLTPEETARFAREARTAASLHHTNIVPVFGVGEDAGQHYYVMQFIEGRSLEDVLTDARGEARDCASTVAITPMAASATTTVTTVPSPADGDAATDGPREPERPRRRLDPRRVARIGIQVADALEHAHSQGVFHRDVKPANLLLDAAGTVWVTDFGLARLDSDDGLTQSGDVLGTLQYLAPERLEGRGDARSDVYSLGMTLYELLTLEPPYPQASAAELLRRIGQSPPRRPRDIDPDIPRDMETIVLKAIAADPAHRYATAEALGRDLTAFLDDRPIAARRATRLERLWRWARRNPQIAGLSATSLALLVAIAVVATIGYVETGAALHVASLENQKANANLRLALAAFEEIFAQVDTTGTFLPVAWTEEESETESEADGEPRFPPIVSEEYVTILERLLGFYEKFAEANTDDPALELQMARAHARVGDIHRRFGRDALAMEAWSHADAVYAALARRPDAPAQAWREQVQLAVRRGDALRDTGDFRGARAAYETGLSLVEDLPEATSRTPEARFESARLHLALGDRGPGPGPSAGGRGPPRGGPPAAPSGGRRPRTPQEDHRGKAIATLEALTTEHPGVALYRATLARAYRDLRVFRRDAAGLPEDPIGEAIRLFEELRASEPTNPEYTFELSLCHAAALFGGPRGDDAETQRRAHLARAIELGRQLVTHYPAVPQYAIALARSELRAAEGLAEAAGFEESRALVDEVIGHLEAIDENAPSVVYYLARAEFFRGVLDRKVGRPAAAVTAFESAANRLESTVTGDRRPGPSVSLYLDIAEEMSATLRELGDDTRAQSVDEHVAPLLERFPRRWRSLRRLRELEPRPAPPGESA